MPPELRFHVPQSNRRPFGSHRFDAWSPKAARRVTLFGQRSLRAWVAIEADSTISHFCERPLVVESSKPTRVIDFWVQRTSSEEELWILLRTTECSTDEPVVSSAFQQWSQTQGFTPRLLPPEEPAMTDEQFQNWGTVLRYLAANRKLLTEDLINGVQQACDAGVGLGALEHRFQHHDPILVRTALFQLLHRGAVRTTEFTSTLIHPSMRFELA